MLHHEEDFGQADDVDPSYCELCGHVICEPPICQKCHRALGVAIEDFKEQQSDDGIDMRDAAFLWAIGIRVDPDMLFEFRIYRRMQCAGYRLS